MNARTEFPLDLEPPPVGELRVPPHSLEAEQAMLGALMLDAQHLPDVQAVLAEADLYRSEHRSIFAAISSLVGRGREVDILTVHDQLPADLGVSLSYLNDLAAAAPAASGAVRYARIVADRASQRRLLSAVDRASTIAWEPGQDADEKVDQIAAVMAGIERRAAGRAPRLIGDVVLQRTQHYQDLADDKTVSGWAIGLPTIDRMLGGGFRPGGVYVIAARPSVGKSSLAQQLALRCAEGGRVTLLLSQEMPAGELADRAVSHVGGVDYGRIANGDLGDDWGAILEASEQLRNIPLWIDDEEALTLRKVHAKARGVKGLQVLVVDYLQLMQSDGRSDANRNAEIERISRGMKALAKQLGIAVVLLSQLNRQVELRTSKRPTCADLRDSGAIEQDADVVMLLWSHRELEQGHRIVGLRVDKNRQGRKGDVALHFDGARQRWAESTQPLDEPAQKRGHGGDL